PVPEHTKLGEDEIRQRVLERLDWVGLEGVEDTKPAALSGGMRKRVGLARAIVMDPKYILYDEPTTGLDPIMADVIDRLVRSLQRRMGITSIVVTHDIASAYKVADRIAMLPDGKIVDAGTVDETRTTENPMVRQFIEGSSEGPIQVCPGESRVRTMEIAVGATVLIAAVILIGGVYWLRDFSANRDMKVWHVVFSPTGRLAQR